MHWGYIDSFYLKKENLLFINYINRIEIMIINPRRLFIEKRIQTIYIQNCSFLNMNRKLLVLYNNENELYLYQRINGINIYQLRSKLAINSFSNAIGLLKPFYNIRNFPLKNILKLDDKTILITKKSYIYLINIPKMEIKKTINFIKIGNNKVDFIYEMKNIIFICLDNYTYIFNYYNNDFSLVCTIYLTNLFLLNYLTNISLENNFPDSDIKIFISPKQKYLLENIIDDNIEKFRNEMKYLNEIIYKEQKDAFFKCFKNHWDKYEEKFLKSFIELDNYIYSEKILNRNLIINKYGFEGYYYFKKRIREEENSSIEEINEKKINNFHNYIKRKKENNNKRNQRKIIEINKNIYSKKLQNKFKKNYR